MPMPSRPRPGGITITSGCPLAKPVLLRNPRIGGSVELEVRRVELEAGTRHPPEAELVIPARHARLRGDLEVHAAALPLNDHLHGPPCRSLAHDPRQVPGAPHPLAIELDHDVTGGDAGLRGRAVFTDIRHDRAAHLLRLSPSRSAMVTPICTSAPAQALDVPLHVPPDAVFVRIDRSAAGVFFCCSCCFFCCSCCPAGGPAVRQHRRARADRRGNQPCGDECPRTHTHLLQRPWITRARPRGSLWRPACTANDACRCSAHQTRLHVLRSGAPARPGRLGMPAHRLVLSRRLRGRLQPADRFTSARQHARALHSVQKQPDDRAAQAS